VGRVCPRFVFLLTSVAIGWWRTALPRRECTDVYSGRATRETVCAEARKTPLRGEGQAFRVPLIGCRKTRHQPHQPLIGSEMPVDIVAEVPLTGLSL
jgi:hypothetical protein